MSYSALYTKKSNKILLILGVVSFISLFVGGTLFVAQLGRVNGWKKIEGIERAYVVNRSPHGFEVIWSKSTSSKEDQWVEVGKEKNMYPIQSRMEKVGEVYHAVISGLQPDTVYYFRIRAGISTYILPSLVSERVHTPKEMKENPTTPAYGKVVVPSSLRPYANGFLMYEIDGYYPLAAQTKETGEWLLPLTGLVEKKSNSIASIGDSFPVSIRLFSYPEGVVRATVSQTRPLKQAITAGVSLALAQTTQGINESVLGATTQTPAGSQQKNTSSIIYPKENALIPGAAPLIRGTAPPGADITVLIQASTKQYSYRAKADDTGNWLVQSPLILEPGNYTILATIKNTSGMQTVTRRSFSIIKSGEQVLGVATGSPTLVPTQVVVPTYANPTAVPTGIVTPTRLPTSILPTRFIPTTTPPVTGGGMSGFLFGALFCIVVGTGLVLAF